MLPPVLFLLLHVGQPKHYLIETEPETKNPGGGSPTESEAPDAFSSLTSRGSWGGSRQLKVTSKVSLPVQLGGQITISCNANKALGLCMFKPPLSNRAYRFENSTQIENGRIRTSERVVKDPKICEILVDNVKEKDLGAWSCVVRSKCAKFGGKRKRFDVTESPAACGKKNERISNRIIGGQDANPNEWPWIAAILDSTNGESSCGGSLISESHVITAAHCVDQKAQCGENGIGTEFVVRVGEHSFLEEGETADETFKVASINIHKDWNPQTFENDIAILKLDGSATRSALVSQICLPSPSEKFANKKAHVIGWGFTSPGANPSPVLQEVEVRVLENKVCHKKLQDWRKADVEEKCKQDKKDKKEDCKDNNLQCNLKCISGFAECFEGVSEFPDSLEELFSNTEECKQYCKDDCKRSCEGEYECKYDYPVVLNEKHICATGEDKGSCRGDSGGPLNCLNPATNSWELCGIVSWGSFPCVQPGHPRVYSRVTEYLPWIENIVNNPGNEGNSSAENVNLSAREPKKEKGGERPLGEKLRDGFEVRCDTYKLTGAIELHRLVSEDYNQLLKRKEEITSTIIDSTCAVDEYGYVIKEVTPLYLACFLGSSKAALLLLNKGADPNKAAIWQESGEERTPLSEAVLSGFTEVVKNLLQSGAKDLDTDLEVAKAKKYNEIVKLLEAAQSG